MTSGPRSASDLSRGLTGGRLWTSSPCSGDANPRNWTEQDFISVRLLDGVHGFVGG